MFRKSSAFLTLSALLISSLAVTARADEDMIETPAPYSADQILLNNVYVRSGGMGSNLFSQIVIGASVLNGSTGLPFIGGAIASLKDPACEKIRKVIENISSDAVQFSTGNCVDKRRLALDTIVFGASNWGFGVIANLKKGLQKGANPFPSTSQVILSKKPEESIIACGAVLSTLSHMKVTADDIYRKRDSYGRPIYANRIDIEGTCSQDAQGTVTLTVTPVFYRD